MPAIPKSLTHPFDVAALSHQAAALIPHLPRTVVKIITQSVLSHFAFDADAAICVSFSNSFHRWPEFARTFFQSWSSTLNHGLMISYSREDCAIGGARRVVHGHRLNFSLSSF